MSVKRSFGKLYVTHRIKNGNHVCSDMVRCKCDCGRTMEISYSSLRNGFVDRCGMCKLTGK